MGHSKESMGILFLLVIVIYIVGSTIYTLFEKAKKKRDKEGYNG